MFLATKSTASMRACGRNTASTAVAPSTPRISACAAAPCATPPPAAAARPKTLAMWDRVLDGETRYIKGFKTTADFLLDTSFTYELGLIAKLLQKVRQPVHAGGP